MDYEIEFHPVGDGTKAGDAILVRYIENGAYRVIVIDGGTTDCGKALVAHITKVYGPETVIAHAVSTHPDSDHASGLREVLKAFPVETLWIHGIWHHSAEMQPYFEDGLTQAEIQNSIEAAYPIVSELITIAADKGANVFEPFAGEQIGPFTVLSPSKDAYLRLVPQFRRTPDANKEALEAENFWLGATKDKGMLARIFEKAAAAVATWIDERWDVELLRENPCTAAENESSTVLVADFGPGHRTMLTGDAGVNALHWACDFAESSGLQISPLNLVQVPHHGSRSNVAPSLLNRILGQPVQSGSVPTMRAVVSCPKDDEKHPRKMVVNAFTRRGCKVFKTQGSYVRIHQGAMPPRGTEQAAEPFGWFDAVEAYD